MIPLKVSTRQRRGCAVVSVLALVSALVGLVVLLNLPAMSKSRILVPIEIGFAIVLVCLLLTNVYLRARPTNAEKDTCIFCLCRFEDGETAVLSDDRFLLHEKCYAKFKQVSSGV